MEHFKTILDANNYAPSTIERYVRHLKNSDIDLTDRRAVHRYLSRQRIDEDSDVHGEKFRAFLLYHRFLRNAKLPGGRVRRPSSVTIDQVCLRHTLKEDRLRVRWLHARGYTPLVASNYVKNSHKDVTADRHGDVYRAHMALRDFRNP